MISEKESFVDTAYYTGKTDVLTIAIQNKSSSEFTLQNRTDYTLHDIPSSLQLRQVRKKLSW
jgi:hypothetical protein